MILMKFAFALLTLLPMSSAAPAERTQLSVVAGDTPRSVRINGPKNLTDLGKRKNEARVGCGYSIHWGDGSISPQGADCGEGLSHIYKDAGTQVFLMNLRHVFWSRRRIVRRQLAGIFGLYLNDILVTGSVSNEYKGKEEIRGCRLASREARIQD